MSELPANVIVWAPVAVVTAALMDAWAALLHEHVWHAWLWKVHRSHHDQRTGIFQANDALSLAHAPLAVALIVHGCRGAPGIWREAAFGAGVGMSAFGLAYVLVHDGFIHGRLRARWLVTLPLLGRPLRAIARAHRAHHASGASSPPYGLFLGPWERRRALSLRFGTNLRLRTLRHVGLRPLEAVASSLPPSPSATRASHEGAETSFSVKRAKRELR